MTTAEQERPLGDYLFSAQERLGHLQDLGFTETDLALGTGVHPKRLEGIEAPGKHAEAVASLYCLFRRYEQWTDVDTGEIVAWMTTPDETLGRRPLVLADPGEGRMDDLVALTHARFGEPQG